MKRIRVIEHIGPTTILEDNRDFNSIIVENIEDAKTIINAMKRFIIAFNDSASTDEEIQKVIV